MFTRRRAAEPALAADGTAACPLCGIAVEITADGRCRLGHQVMSEESAARHLAAHEATEVQAEDVPAPAGPPTAPAPPTESQPARDTDQQPAALAGLDGAASDTVPLQRAQPDAEPSWFGESAPLGGGDVDAQPTPPVPTQDVDEPAHEQPAEPEEHASEESAARTRLLEAASWFSDAGS